jgi:hypothetical protein
MLKRHFISALALILTATACAGEDGDTPAVDQMNMTPASGGSTGTTPANNPTTQTQNNAPEPFEREFEALVEQAAPWGGLEVKVTGARLYRGARPEDLAPLVQYSANNVYAVLDINITQLANGETNYTNRNTWDLILADGTRERSVNSLGVTIVTGDSPTVKLYYSATEDTSFVGAALEVNGADRTTLEPMRIPLDTAGAFESEVELTSLVGQVIAPMAEGDLSFEVLDASYGANLIELERRAPVDQRLVALNTRVSYSGAFSKSFSAVDDGPKLSVNGNSLSAREGEIDTIPSGGSIDFLTLYAIDEDATEFDVVLDTGDEVFVRLPVVLPARP